MKKKIFALTLCVIMAAIFIVGGTLAYFTDDHEQTNTFTTGDVKIKLTEAKVVKVDDPNAVRDTATGAPQYGDLVKDGDKRTKSDQDYGKLYPAQNIYKDPTIKNVGSEDAYVAAKVTVTSDGDLLKILGAEENGVKYDILALNQIISGGIEDETFTQEYWNGRFVNNCDSYAVYQQKEGTNTFVLYFFIKDPLKAATKDAVTLFTNIQIPPQWNNAEMAELENLTITVKAFATQEYGFKDCFTAITTAFPTDFPFATP